MRPATADTATGLADLTRRSTVVQRIPLAKGRGFALVDDDDVPLISGYTWNLQTGSSTVDYATAYIPGSGHNGRNVLMHVLITGRLGTDHANGNGLDNRRENLRPATRAQNMANSRKAAGCSSAYKGVCLTRWGWQAYIKVDRKRRHLGYFAVEEAAACAYDAAASAAWGEFARLNFPDGLDGIGEHARKGAGKSSQYRGVSWNKAVGRWYAHITGANRPRHIGVFAVEEEAARAYDAAALAAWGEHARLNFPA